MIRQNIKVALFVILGLITFWLIMFGFIKLDVASEAWVNVQENTVMTTAKIGAYIQNHNNHIKIKIVDQYISYTLSGVAVTEQYWTFTVLEPLPIDPTIEGKPVSIIVDSLNIYQYLLKK